MRTVRYVALGFFLVGGVGALGFTLSPQNLPFLGFLLMISLCKPLNRKVSPGLGRVKALELKAPGDRLGDGSACRIQAQGLGFIGVWGLL